MRFILTCRTHFDAAHFLPKYEGKCRNLHGHRWEVEVVLESEKLDQQGMVADFSLIKKTVDGLDHCLLNDTFTNPTAELLVKWLFEKISLMGMPVRYIELWESSGCSVKVCSE
jgi:6-pyruvoyltetrahydropterin/6-carboxytetrahydropterin synthase